MVNEDARSLAEYERSLRPSTKGALAQQSVRGWYAFRVAAGQEPFSILSGEVVSCHDRAARVLSIGWQAIDTYTDHDSLIRQAVQAVAHLHPDLQQTAWEQITQLFPWWREMVKKARPMTKEEYMRTMREVMRL